MYTSVVGVNRFLCLSWSTKNPYISFHTIQDNQSELQGQLQILLEKVLVENLSFCSV